MTRDRHYMNIKMATLREEKDSRST